jgi:hypothetical protein
MKLRHTIAEGTYAYSNLYLKKKTPVIVYAPGRVGSMGLIKNLRDADVFSFKVESFIDEKRGATQFCKKHVVDAKKSAKIITLVRDPVAIMSSYYFSKGTKGWLPEAKTALESGDVPALQKIFVSEVLRTKRLDSHLYWYENDFNPSLGFNIFDYTFDTQNQHTVIDHPQFPTLVVRTELSDLKKEATLNNFLGTTNIKITRENVRTEKVGTEIYKKFKESLSLPSDILEKIYTAPYAAHFFSNEEREQLRKKWS